MCQATSGLRWAGWVERYCNQVGRVVEIDEDVRDDDTPLPRPPGRAIWVALRVEIMGSQKCRIVGKSQPALIMINPIIFTRARMGRA